MSTFTSEPGIRLGGRYRLEDRLAAASGWSAWKAIDEILARPVSVITFAAGFPRLEQVVTAARAASRLTDTRLTQVFDVEDSWERPYIVLEWPAGETLADLLAPGTLEPAAGARIVAEVASALSGAHAAGLAHLCLRPDTVRWTAGGGVKVTGLGIDAALAGVTSEDPQLADTRGLGQLLYAALTGLWPGPDYPGLPGAPEADGEPRRPRQVRAGVPTGLDDVAGRALGLPGREASFTSPAELAAALSAAVPPEEIPLAAALQRGSWRDPGRFGAGRTTDSPWTAPQQDNPGATQPPGGPRYQQDNRRRRTARIAAVTVLVLAAAAGASAAAIHLLHKSPSPAPAASRRPGHTSSPSSAASSLRVVSASGFDALNPSDSGDENTNQAPNVLDGGAGGWDTQQYYGSPYFGGLKKGTGLILNLGKPVQVTSVTVDFGSVPGANVEIREGSSDARSATNLASMQTVASVNNVSGKYTFTVAHPVSDQYLVIWFTKLPPVAGSNGKHKGQAVYMGQVFSVAVQGRD
jgi:serine/threonine protein kinase